MTGFRPRPSALFLERPRLLNLLPEEPGYIVWLEAPYGYGKSVLVSQWVARLEPQGWRVLWLALVDSDPRPTVAALLGSSEEAPWSALLEMLTTQPTLLIFEDLEHNPDAVNLLGPLLKHNPALVVLSSRHALHSPELLRARGEGRLIHLRAEHLAFTASEAETLFAGKDAGPAWAQTRGWSLPLHMAALTGELPDPDGLWEGVRQSLESDVWREVLLLAALPYLPLELADARCAELARLGFVQALENGFRLHPLAAETVFKRHAEDVRSSVQANLQRLPLALRAEACARSGLLEDLTTLLEDYHLAMEDSPGVLRWDALCPDDQPSASRLLTLSWALSVTGQHERAMQTYLRAAEHPDAGPAERLNAYGWALFDLRPDEFHRADALLEGARPWLTHAQPRERGSFLVNAATFFIEAHRWADAEPLLEEAVPVITETNALAARINLALVRWELHGHLGAYLSALEDSAGNPNTTPFNVCMALEALGQFRALLGQTASALEAFERLEALREHCPDVAFQGKVTATALRVIAGEQPLETFAALEREAKPTQTSFVRAHWARCLRLAGRAEDALARLEEASDGVLARVERALTLHTLGRSKEALAHLEPGLNSTLRLEVVRARAARFCITQKSADLERLIALTDAGAALLPGLVPISSLPKTRVDLAGAYPLEDVLASGWRAAVQARHDQIPRLEVKVLGGFAVRLLGRPLALTGRPRDILLLLALEQSRDAIAEALWPDADIERSRNNLNVNLNHLRKRLEPWGVPTYLLENGLTRCHVDLSDLESALTRRDVAAVRAVYADLAPDVDLPAITQAREQYRVQTLHLALEHARAHPSDEDALEWLLGIDPFHEEALSLLLEHLVRTGRRISARRRYEAYARQLQTTLGLEPAPQTARIVTANANESPKKRNSSGA
jgi:DNA-binding SARP family transcriptional activator